MIIAIGNLGSTSLKTRIVEIDSRNRVSFLGEANLDRITSEGESTFSHRVGEGPKLEEKVEVLGFEQGLGLVLGWYTESGVIREVADIKAVGFKTVLAGTGRGACRLDGEVLAEMKRFAFVAPAHNLPYVQTIEMFAGILGEVPLVGVFETSFHHCIPEHRRLTGLPLEMERSLGLEQKGFHGATGRYGTARIRQMHLQYCRETGRGMPSPFRLVYNHLGGSSSTHAIEDGKSVATSMRFSPQSGHFQGTRVGDIDVYAVLYAMRRGKLSPGRMEEILSSESGLAGISGIGSGEMADILDAAGRGDHRARLAVEAYAENVRQYIGAYAAVLNGVDALGFAGGIGEKAPGVRAAVCAGLEYLGVRLDPRRNDSVLGTDGRISADSSPVQVYVVQANEELVVAFFTRKVVELGRDLSPAEMQFDL
ncbi:MAG: acetate/propionate family kinase [Candidatus Glassbacteria bacterium]|nr:acetate/propionate family kinase [Candidatus Glassbacteria bacterium]